jgi:hypothetical protein
MYFVKPGKYSLANFVYVCILRAEIITIFVSKMITISARNANLIITEYANFARLYFPYFTTFRNQSLQFY